MCPIQRATAVEKLFPPGVIAFEIRGVASPDDLFPSERECVARAVERRVREFAAGRLCARAGLMALGLEPTRQITRAEAHNVLREDRHITETEFIHVGGLKVHPDCRAPLVCIRQWLTKSRS